MPVPGWLDCRDCYDARLKIIDEWPDEIIPVPAPLGYELTANELTDALTAVEMMYMHLDYCKNHKVN